MINLHDLAHDRGEQRVLFLRPHWFLLIPLLVGFIIILALPFAVWYGMSTINPGVFATPEYVTLYVLGASIFFLFTWLFLFQHFMDYYLDMWLITTHRIIDIQQTGLFGRTTAELLLENVQDATSEVHGFIHTFFDYGTLTIQTAAEDKRFVFEEIPHPTHVARRILELAAARRIELEKIGNS